jgi:hypothetical protein
MSSLSEVAPVAPSLFAKIRERSMLLLLLLLVVTVFVLPAILPHGPIERFVVGVLMTLLLLAGVLAAAEHRRIVWVLAWLSVLSIVVRWIGFIVPSTLLPAAQDLSMLLALSVLAVAVGINVFGAGKAVVDRIMGAVVLYLLIGLAWAVAYSFIDAHSPGAFTGAGDGAETENQLARWVYFSFVTLTTVGYGDITPVARAARSLAMLEALVGQLYPAVILARLVSLSWEKQPPAGGSQA